MHCCAQNGCLEVGFVYQGTFHMVVRRPPGGFKTIQRTGGILIHVQRSDLEVNHKCAVVRVMNVWECNLYIRKHQR